MVMWPMDDPEPIHVAHVTLDHPCHTDNPAWFRFLWIIQICMDNPQEPGQVWMIHLSKDSPDLNGLSTLHG